MLFDRVHVINYSSHNKKTKNKLFCGAGPGMAETVQQVMTRTGIRI